MPEDNITTPVSPEALPQVQSFWRRGEQVFYGIAALAEGLVAIGALQFEMPVVEALALGILVWWAVMIYFWSSPVFCHFELERQWLSSPSRFQQVAASVIYWPILVPKRFYLWLVVVGAGVFYFLKYR